MGGNIYAGWYHSSPVFKTIQNGSLFVCFVERSRNTVPVLFLASTQSTTTVSCFFTSVDFFLYRPRLDFTQTTYVFDKIPFQLCTVKSTFGQRELISTNTLHFSTTCNGALVLTSLFSFDAKNN